MKSVTQNLLLMLLGGVLLQISAFSGTYANYVRPGFRPLLIGAGVVLLALAGVGLWNSRRTSESGHHQLPRVAWLLSVPVFAIVLISPPALGSFAAQREQGPPPPVAKTFQPLNGDSLTLGEFIGRAYSGSGALNGKQVKLTGFVVAGKDRWYIARMQISCCAADAIALKVAVEGQPAPREDTWVEVTGTWVPWKGKIPTGFVAPSMKADQVTKTDQPAEPYE